MLTNKFKLIKYNICMTCKRLKFPVKEIILEFNVGIETVEHTLDTQIQHILWCAHCVQLKLLQLT
jgi:hypothetical protein